jgi:hypothetical protein
MRREGGGGAKDTGGGRGERDTFEHLIFALHAFAFLRFILGAPSLKCCKRLTKIKNETHTPNRSAPAGTRAHTREKGKDVVLRRNRVVKDHKVRCNLGHFLQMSHQLLVKLAENNLYYNQLYGPSPPLSARRWRRDILLNIRMSAC